MMLIEKQQKCQHFHLEKLINMNILQLKKYCLLIKKELIEQTKLTYSLLGKALKKKKQLKIKEKNK